MSLDAWPVLVLAAALGGAAGLGGRWLLGRLRRGTSVRPGPLELAGAVVTVVGVVAAWDDGRWPMVAWIGWLLVVLSAVDLREHRLPDAITLPAVLITAVVAIVQATIAPGSVDLRAAAITGVVVGAAFFGIAYAAPSAMGRGDAKLSVSLGIALGCYGPVAALLGVFAGFVLGSAAGLIGIVARRRRWRSALPFGPALLLGCWLVLLIPELSDRVSGL